MKAKNIALALAAALLVCLLGACGSAQSNDADLPALRVKMNEAAGFQNMLIADSTQSDARDLFAYFSDLDYDKVSGYFLLYSPTGTAEEIAVVEVKDLKDVEAAKASLEEHLASRLKMFRNYDPKQVPMLESAIVTASGRLVALIICDNPSAVRAAID